MIDDFLSGKPRPAGSGRSTVDDFLGGKPAPGADDDDPGLLAGRSAADIAKDIGITALKGAVGVPQAIVGLADIPTLGHAGKALEELGFRPADAQRFLDERYSEPQQAAHRAVREADGFVPTVVAGLQNPSTILTTVGESLPAMGAGGLVGRGLMAVAPKVMPWVAGGIGEGVIGAGQAASQIREEAPDGLLTPKQAGAALASGVGTAALGAVGGKVASRLGVPDVDTMIASGNLPATPGGFTRAIVGGGISEGLFEELPQSAQEQVWQNVALNRPISEKVGNAAATGLMAGGLMGGAGGGFSAAMNAMTPAAAAGPPPVPTPGTAPTTAPPPPAPPAATTTAAEKALRTPVTLTTLDRVNEIDGDLAKVRQRRQELTQENGYGPAFDGERSELFDRALRLEQERDKLTADWPARQAGAPTTFSTEAGARLDAQYALMDADDLQTSHDENLRPNPTYPTELQPRERDRAASEMQIAGIVSKLDPARLGVSADAATGAPIVGADGLVESGNARTIALKRVYGANGQKASDYRDWLAQNAAQFGLSPEQVAGMGKPVLVRVRTTPVNRAEFARQANASTVAQMAPSEQARSDAARIEAMDDLRPDENGDFSGPASRPFVRRFMARLPMTEQAGMVDADGKLSTAGYARVRNAVLAKAYGDSPVLLRMVESMDDTMRNVTRALTIAAPRVAQLREAIGKGDRFDSDITPDLLASVEELARLKDSGRSVSDALAQVDAFGEQRSPEGRELLQFLADNLRRPRRMADFLTEYMSRLDAAGDPKQGSMFGDAEAPAKLELMVAARAAVEGTDGDGQDAGAAAPAGTGSATTPGGARGNQGGPGADARGAAANDGLAEVRASRGGQQAPEWVGFPAGSTLGIARADMPQVKGADRGALVQFLAARGIERTTEEGVSAESLRPTQAEFSPAKVRKWAEMRDGDRSVIASSDGYILDGHHQWMASLAQVEPVKVLWFNAPIRDLMQAVHDFPSSFRAEGAGADPATLRAQAVEAFNDALADLAAIFSRHTRAAFVSETDEPNLMPTLVRLFDAGMKLIGTDMKRLTAWVKDSLRQIPEFKTKWNKIAPETYAKAAREALAQAESAGGAQADLFGSQPTAAATQADLFSQPKPRAASEATGSHKAGVEGSTPSPATATPQAPKFPESAKSGAQDVAPLAVGDQVEVDVRGGKATGVVHREPDALGDVWVKYTSHPHKQRIGQVALAESANVRRAGQQKPAAPPQQATIDGRPYDPKRDNFDKRYPLATIAEQEIPADVMAAAREFVKAHPVGEQSAPTITAEERTKAEELMRPRIKLAEEAKPAYDTAVLDIVRETGALGQMLAPIKKLARAAEKLVLDEGFKVEGIKDLLRSTIIVGSYSDAQKVVDAIRQRFDVSRIKDRSDSANITGDKVQRVARSVFSNYADVLVNVVTENGTIAEIQINVPVMLAAKEGGPGHDMYVIDRSQPQESALSLAAVAAQKVYYEAAFLAAAERYDAAKLKNLSESIDTADLSGMRPAGSKAAPSSDSLNTLPSGSSTNSSPPKDMANLEPSGNLSGSFIAPSTDPSLPAQGTDAYTENATGERNAGDGNRGAKSDAGARPEAVSGDGRQGQIDLLPERAGGRDQPGDRRAGGRDRGTAGVQPTAENRPDEGGRDDEHGAGAGEGGSSARGADVPGKAASGPGRTGAGRKRVGPTPVARDIPPKSGRNFAFGPDDLNYSGSWFQKAEANVAAVELLKKLEADGRQATRDEQAVLARFIGWGASEIASNLFSDKNENVASKLAAHAEAIESLAGRNEIGPRDASYYSVYKFVSDSSPQYFRYGETIPRALVDKLRPKGDAVRWAKLRAKLKEALTEDEWADASRSTQNAHFTSKQIVRSMWAALGRMGFKGGLAFEPGAGIGVFPGLMPEAMAANTAYTGIELDAITGRILQHLFPDERIVVGDFITTKFPKNFYDVAAGNPPFADFEALADPEYKLHAFKLHDFFFAKTIDRVKPGGLVAFVTSRFTMDKLNDKARAYLAERADLVGAIRLPQTAFKQNAGTEVVTDVLFLRKKVDGAPWAGAQAWAKSVPMNVNGRTFTINEYFHAHPEMVLGTHSDAGKMRAKNEYTVLPREGDIEAQFAAAVETLPADIMAADRGSAADEAAIREIDTNPTVTKEGNYYVTAAGVLMQVEGGVGVRVTKQPKDTERLRDYVPLRDALKQAHYDQLNEGDWESSLKKLQAEYRKWVAKHGRVNQFRVQTVSEEVEVDRENPTTGEIETVTETVEKERRVFWLRNKLRDDPDHTLVAALEVVNADTGEITDSQFLTDRVLGGPAQEAKIETAADAMLSTLNDLGKVDLPTIAGRIGLSEAETIEALGSAIYDDPESGWVTADDYLSGNVRAKLDAAREAAQGDRRYQRNVDALEAVQPAPKTAGQINVALGMNWIPGKVYAEFVESLIGGKVNVAWNEPARRWVVEELSPGEYMRRIGDWGTPSYPTVDLLLAGLTGQPIRVERDKTGPDGKKIGTEVDPAATEAAQAKLAALRAEFSKWLWTDAARTDELTRLYNDRFNTHVPRSFDGRHLTLPGTSKRFNVFDHVKRGAWRIIQNGNTYLAHAVGSGKTFASVISAMEQRRLGLIKKPMFAVPNHMLEQFASEWQALYPTAKLLIADKANFQGDNRRRFLARTAMSDLDGVVITHSAFKLIDIDQAFKNEIIEEQLTYMRAALRQAGGDPDNPEYTRDGKRKYSRDPTIKQIEQAIQRMEERLKGKLSGAGKDTNVTFDQLGVDMLYVDEAHEYRKLDYTTARKVKGLSPAGSQRSLDLYIKARWLEKQRPGRSLVMMSGTPVTNTLAELYSVQRFLGAKTLADKGLDDFDSWASMFGRELTRLEPGVDGKYRQVTRFQDFVNVPELTMMFREFADVLTADHLAAALGDERPGVEGGSRQAMLTPKTEQYKAYLRDVLQPRSEASLKWKPTREEPNNPDPIINIITDGRLAAIDMRFADPSLPPDPDSKLNRMIDKVIEVANATKDQEFVDKAGNVEPNKGATMMVFSDLGFGAGVTERRGFNARAWFEKRLRDGGIPANQIAFMSDYKKDADKLELFKAVNTGRVRVLVGSTKNMGTGVNAQQRLRALFHLDAPWYPADLEQREGRIIRSGNKHAKAKIPVQIYAFATKGTYDQQMWGLLSSKQHFIDLAMSGDPNLREISDLSEQSLMEQLSGMLADDPRVLELAGKRADIARLERLYEAHEQQRARFRDQHRQAGMIVESLERRMPLIEKAAAQAVDLSGDKFRAKVDGKEFDDRTKWAERLIERYKELLARGADKPTKIGEISGFPISFVGEMVAGKYVGRAWLETPVPPMLINDGGESPIGLAMRAQNAVVDTARDPAKVRQQIADRRAEMVALEPRLNARFTQAEELADLVREARALELEIASDANKVWRVTRAADGQGYDVKAPSMVEAIQAAIRDHGGTAEDWEATEIVAPPTPDVPDVKASRRPALGARGYYATRAVQAIRKALGAKPIDALLALGAEGKPGGLIVTDTIDEAVDAYARVNGLPLDHRAVAGLRSDGSDMNGFYDPSSGIAFVVAENAGQNAASVALHEVGVHAWADGVPGDRKAALNRRAAEVVRSGDDDVSRAARKRMVDAGHMTDDGKVLNAEEAWAYLAEEADRATVAGRTVIARVRNLLLDVLSAIRAALYRRGLVVRAGALTPRDLAAIARSNLLGQAENAMRSDALRQGLWLQRKAQQRGYESIDELARRNAAAFIELAEQWRKRNPLVASRSEATKAAYERRIDALFAGEPAAREGVKVLDRTELLGLLQYADRPVHLLEGKVRDGMDKHPNMTTDVWKKVPQWLDAPAAVFDSDSEKGRLVFVAPELVDGSIALLIVEPDRQVSGSLTAHLLLNAYDKNEAAPPFRSWLDRNLARYVDQRKFPEVLSRARLRLPREAMQNQPGTRRILTERNLAGYIRANPPTEALRSVNMSAPSASRSAPAPKPGETFVVYRVASEKGLRNANAGDPAGIAAFLAAGDSFDNPTVAAKGTHLHAYRVKVEKPMGDYQTMNAGRGEANAVGRMVKWGGAQYSFPAGGFTATHVGSVPMSEVRAALRERGYADFDEAGAAVGGEVIRELLPVAAPVLASRSVQAGAQSPQAPRSDADRAQAIIDTKVGGAKPLDRLARVLTRVTGIERLTGEVYRRAGALLDRLTPEAVKAGVISDYGIPEAVIDQRSMLQGRQRVQLRKAGNLIDKLSTLTRAESRAVYEYMNGDRTAEETFSGLPAESQRAVRDVQQMIDRLSQDAVDLGQLSAEAFERHRGAYLHRSYAKHVMAQTAATKQLRARAMSVLGEQYRGRGIVEQAGMDRIKAAAPEWWKRKLAAGKADAGLKGEKFVRYERLAHTGEGTAPLEGIGDRQERRRVLEVNYWPAGEPVPSKYADWTAAGTFEVRDVKGPNLILWRDFTKAERERMGEIDEARFAIAKTLQGMIHDVEVGRYLEWLGRTYAKMPGETIPGKVVEASERMRDTFGADEWVKVPETKADGTGVYRYGKLAGQYIPGPIWNDLRQVVAGRYAPLGDTYQAILRAWKTSKTALSPAVHMNNVMANVVMADWHDVSALHVAKALRIVLAASGASDGRGVLKAAGNLAGRAAALADREAAAEILNRYKDSGGEIGSWTTQEIARDQIDPLLAALEQELAASAGGSAPGQVGVFSAVQLALRPRFGEAWAALAASKPGQAVTREGSALIDLYQSEDDLFRLAAWLKAKEGGATDAQAGKAARRSFLDYRINAPWIQMMRATAFPFIAFTYRAVPMLIETAAKRPHKILKLMALAGAANALGVMIGGGGDDDERKLLPEEKAGRVWGLVPKLVRMPWNDRNGSPVYLDIRRWIPVGDVFDLGQNHAAVPMLPVTIPGGPLSVLAEVVLNRSQFTGRPITLDTDDWDQAAGKVLDHLYKAFAPNILGLPGTHATTGVADAAFGRTDSFGRERSVAQAVASSMGVKLGSYPADVLRQNLQRRAQAQIMEIDRVIAGLKRQRQTNAIDADEFEQAVGRERAKQQKVRREVAEKVGG